MRSMAGARRLLQSRSAFISPWSSAALRWQPRRYEPIPQQESNRWYSAAAEPISVAKEPSKVLFVKVQGSDINENDVLKLVKPFGSISSFVQLKQRNQALMQMQDVDEAVNVVQHYTSEQPRIRGKDVHFEYSSHQELTSEPPQNEKQPGRVLLVSIRNPLYQINVDILHKVFEPHGDIHKIVIFQKSGLQAFIQYSNEESATDAKAALDGREIFDNCCQMDIQYSKMDDVEIRCNNELSRDYTDDTLPEQPGATKKASSILGDGTLYSTPAVKSSVPSSGILPPGVTGMRQQCTLLVSNLNPTKIDEDKLFNLFCGYGKILRIKMFHNTREQALIQLCDGVQAELALNYLRGTLLYGNPLQISFSKNPFIRGANTKDYSTSRFNRFSADYIKNCCSPSKIIHISNLPAEVEEGELINHLAPHGIIRNLKFFEVNGKRQAVCEFKNIEQATEAIMCKNFVPLKGANLRIGFSKFEEVR